MTLVFILILAPWLYQDDTADNGKKPTALEQLQEKLKTDTGEEKGTTLILIARQYLANEPKIALDWAQQAYDFGVELPSLRVQFHATTAISNAHLYINEPNIAMEYAEKALALAKEAENSRREHIAMLNISNLHLRLGDYKEGLTIAHETANQLEQIDEEDAKYELADCYTLIAQFHSSMEHKEKTGEWYQKAMDIYVELDNEIGIGSLKNSFGIYYQAIGDFPKALEMFKEFEAFSKKYNSLNGQSIAYNNIAIAYIGLNDYTSAETYYFKAFDVAKQTNNPGDLCTAHNNLADFYIDTKDKEKAKKHLDQAKEYVEKLNDKLMEEIITETTSRYYELIGDYKKALDLFKEYTSMREALFHEENNKMLAEMEARFDNTRKEREIEQLKLKQEREELIRKEQEHEMLVLKKDSEIVRVTRNALLIGAVLLMVLIFVLFRDYRLKTQTHQVILEKNKELEQLSRTDALTKIMNRRFGMELLEHEERRFAKKKVPFTLVLTDIDHFKSFNDQYGHDCGDYVLIEVAKLLSDTIRKQDFVARWGGEEFLIFLPETNAEGAVIMAERVRETIANQIYEFKDLKLQITLTLGLCEFDGNDDIDHCLKRADDALYEGKRNGRNRVVLG